MGGLTEGAGLLRVATDWGPAIAALEAAEEFEYRGTTLLEVPVFLEGKAGSVLVAPDEKTSIIEGEVRYWADRTFGRSSSGA